MSGGAVLQLWVWTTLMGWDCPDYSDKARLHSTQGLRESQSFRRWAFSCTHISPQISAV